MRGMRAVGLIFGGFVAMFLIIAPQPTKASINPQINFQGKLTNPNGTNVTDGTYSIVFSIYTVDTGGVAVWTETQPSVSVNDGIFRVALGSITSLPGSVDFNGSSLWLGIKVGADAEMTPRVQFTASPYAFNSDRLGGLTSNGFVQLGPGSVQADATTNSSLYINKTASGNLIQLQSSGADVFTVSGAGDILFGQNANHTIGVAQESTNAVGNNLTISAGQGGAGAGANTGGLLVLQGGAGGGTNGAGGNLTIAGGAGSGSGASGVIIIKNPADSTTGFQVQDASSTALFVIDSVNDRIIIGRTTADTVGVLLVLDTKNNAGDPTGVDGGMYYNSSTSKMRCYEAGIWSDCMVNRVLGETTLGTAGNTISVTLSVSAEYLMCRVDSRGLSAAGGIFLRFNNDTGAAAYQWNIYGIPVAAVTDAQDASDSEIQTIGTDTDTDPMSATVHITNFATVNKSVEWSSTVVEPVNTNANRYSGVGVYYNTGSAISSVQFVASAGNFAVGSHAWCEGRNIQ